MGNWATRGPGTKAKKIGALTGQEPGLVKGVKSGGSLTGKGTNPASLRQGGLANKVR